jgi:hypothetical protein
VLPVAEIVDVGDLVNVVWTSIVAGLGVCVVFSLVIIGFARSTDHRREGNDVIAAAYMALGAASFLAVVVLIVYAVVVMTAK